MLRARPRGLVYTIINLHCAQLIHEKRYMVIFQKVKQIKIHHYAFRLYTPDQSGQLRDTCRMFFRGYLRNGGTHFKPPSILKDVDGHRLHWRQHTDTSGSIAAPLAFALLQIMATYHPLVFSWFFRSEAENPHSSPKSPAYIPIPPLRSAPTTLIPYSTNTHLCSNSVLLITKLITKPISNKAIHLKPPPLHPTFKLHQNKKSVQKRDKREIDMIQCKCKMQTGVSRAGTDEVADSG